MVTAFYPCCNRDVSEPIEILAGVVDRVVFCDIDASLHKHWNRQAATTVGHNLPAAEFVVDDALTALSGLGTIHVLFYRRDSDGEGGSGLFVLGDVSLRPSSRALSVEWRRPRY